MSPDAAERVRATADAIYRAESRRVFATLIRSARRLRPRRGGAASTPSRRARAMRRAMAFRRIRAPGWCRPAASRPSTGSGATPGSIRWRGAIAEQVDAVADESATVGRRGHRRRPAAAHLHVLPSGAGAGRAGGAHVARSTAASRPRRSRRRSLSPAPTLAQRIVRAKAKIRDARIPYQVPGDLSELSERLDSVAARDLPGVQRGLLAHHPARSLTRRRLVGRGDTPVGRLLINCCRARGPTACWR